MITLEQVNEIILEENGIELKEDDFLIDSDMDSFSYAMFWFKVADIDDNDSVLTDNYVTKINYVTYSVKDLLDFVNDRS